MNAFLKLSSADQLDAYVEVNRAMGLDAASVEKDFWVCWTLREIFSHPDLGGHITFKGGTSLSKAWKLIERFSEDIDLIVDKEVLGFGGDAAPDKAASNKQRKARLEALMDACRDWVQGTLQPKLASRIQSALGETGWQLEVDPDMPDGQCLLFHYPLVQGSNPCGPTFKKPQNIANQWLMGKFWGNCFGQFKSFWGVFGCYWSPKVATKSHRNQADDFLIPRKNWTGCNVRGR
jgi:hypothetical protein